eukprot:SAG11_NODE_26971_length_338_cov_1.765690_1_plen_55_part_01
MSPSSSPVRSRPPIRLPLLTCLPLTRRRAADEDHPPWGEHAWDAACHGLGSELTL